MGTVVRTANRLAAFQSSAVKVLLRKYHYSIASKNLCRFSHYVRNC